MPAWAQLGLEQRAFVDGAVERRVGGLQQDLRIGDPRLLEMEGGFLGIVLALRQFAVEIGIGGRDRVIVAERPVAAEQRLQDLLAVGGVFQRQANVRVVVGRLVDLHRHHRVPAARRAHDLELRRLGEQRHGLVVDAVDGVDLARDQRVDARRAVVDDRDVRCRRDGRALPSSTSRTFLSEMRTPGSNFSSSNAPVPTGLRPVLEPVRHHQT